MMDRIVITDGSWRAGKLWGASAIARFAGVSVETIYRWERLEDCPISKPGGRYFAVKTALSLWMMTKPARSCQTLTDKPASACMDGDVGAAAYNGNAAMAKASNRNQGDAG